MTAPQNPVLLGVAYDLGRLNARLDVVLGTNIEAIPASSKAAAMGAISQARIDLLVIATDVPEPDRTEITHAFRRHHAGKVIWARLPRGENSSTLPDAYVTPDSPAELQQAMVRLVPAIRKL